MISQKKFSYIRIILIQPSEMQKPETGQKTGPDQPENFMGKWTSMSKEIYLYKKIFDATIRHTKTGNRTENRNPDQLKNFRSELTRISR